jgi:ribonuclease/clavin/mitogillin
LSRTRRWKRRCCIFGRGDTIGDHASVTAERISASVWRLELPSRTLPPFTTTNCYLIVHGGVAAIIDPGFDPDDAASLGALRQALDSSGAKLVKAVLLTHTHGDHVAGLPAVLEACDSPALYVHPRELARVERFAPLALAGERALTVGASLIRALHTPGHSPGHLSFHLPEEGVLLAGDLVAGRGSVWVGVPEGDVSDYLSSLERVAGLRDLRRLGPGHGQVVDEPYRRLSESRDHRLEREAQVMAALEEPLSLSRLREAVYGDLPAELRPAAESSLLAHLRKLMGEMRVLHLGEDESGPFALRR